MPTSLSIISSMGQASPACLRAYLLFCNEHRLHVNMYSGCVCVAGYKEIYLQVKRCSVCVWPLVVMGCLRAYLLCNTEHRLCVLDVQCGCVCETRILLKKQNLLVQLTGPIHLSYSLVVFTCPIHLP